MKEHDALKWVAELFEVPQDEITVETPREDIPAWDSLGVLSLMADLDEKFDLLVTDEQMQQMTTVGDIIDLLKANDKIDQ